MYQLRIGHGLSKSTLTVLDDVIEAPRDVQMMIEPLQIFNPQYRDSIDRACGTIFWVLPVRLMCLRVHQRCFRCSILTLYNEL